MPASWQLRALNALLRRVVRPRLAATPDLVAGRRDFELAMRLSGVAGRVLLRKVPGTPPLHWLGEAPTGGRVILYFHGGGYFAGSPRTHSGLAARLARRTGLPVILPAYRLAPEHPAPAAFEDALAAWAALRADAMAPGHIVLAGDSAGGGLALALLAALCQRGEHPAGAVVLSPWADLSLSGASVAHNADADPFLPAAQVAEVAGLVLDGLDPRDPRVSPLFARFEAPPPVMIEVGSTEILRDDSRRVAGVLRAAGGRVELREVPEAPHAWPFFGGFLPEARAAVDEVATFVAGLSRAE